MSTLGAVSNSNKPNIEVIFGNPEKRDILRFSNELYKNRAMLQEIQSIKVIFVCKTQQDMGFQGKILYFAEASINPCPDYDREVDIFGANFAAELPNILKRTNDCSKIIEQMGRLVKFLKEDKDQRGFARIYEINVMLRHPAVKDKTEVYSAIANNLATAKDDTHYMGLVCNLNDITPPFMNAALAAERSAGASINRYWPDTYDDSTQHPFEAK